MLTLISVGNGTITNFNCKTKNRQIPKRAGDEKYKLTAWAMKYKFGTGFFKYNWGRGPGSSNTPISEAYF